VRTALRTFLHTCPLLSYSLPAKASGQGENPRKGPYRTNPGARGRVTGREDRAAQGKPAGRGYSQGHGAHAVSFWASTRTRARSSHPRCAAQGCVIPTPDSVAIISTMHIECPNAQTGSGAPQGNRPRDIALAVKKKGPDCKSQGQ
jgi:hypothetical protein